MLRFALRFPICLPVVASVHNRIAGDTLGRNSNVRNNWTLDGAADPGSEPTLLMRFSFVKQQATVLELWV